MMGRARATTADAAGRGCGCCPCRMLLREYGRCVRAILIHRGSERGSHFTDFLCRRVEWLEVFKLCRIPRDTGHCDG